MLRFLVGCCLVLLVFSCQVKDLQKKVVSENELLEKISYFSDPDNKLQTGTEIEIVAENDQDSNETNFENILWQDMSRQNWFNYNQFVSVYGFVFGAYLSDDDSLSENSK